MKIISKAKELQIYNEGYYDGYRLALSEMNAKKWTPVSEGLPDENKEVLVTAVFSDDQKEVGTLRLIKGKWTNDFFSYDVIAWMPKPKPYEEEEND